MLSWARPLVAAAVAGVLYAALPARAIVYTESLVDYNLNTNQQATAVTDYTTTRANTTYTPSPSNWRAHPVYTILLDKFANGDPSNDDYFKTIHESDWRETQLRYGGDLKGLVKHLDYIQGMGAGVIFIAGTPFLNMPWEADSYSPIDFSLLDPHWGTMSDWVDTIDAIHARGMYIMVDFTVGTMGDFIGWKQFPNASAPFDLGGYATEWKHPSYAPWGLTEYPDFSISETQNSSCQLPSFWLDTGEPIVVTHDGCSTSEFDDYGDMEAFGVYPDWNRQLAKFASVQDRLREWNPNVMAKIQTYACLTIQALDIDAIRVDKSIQVTLDAISAWAVHTRACAVAVGKKNFMITGEVTGGDTFGSLYLGRGRTPEQRPGGSAPFLATANLTGSESQYFLRDKGQNGLDAITFHYSIYRYLTRFLGMDGNLEAAYDLQPNFVASWDQMFVDNDFLNANTGVLDPRHMFGTSNFDVFRWPSLVNGTQRQAIGAFITTMMMPGMPLVYYGEEQAFYLYDNGASNYLFGRQPMSSNIAWQRHGCYKLGSTQYFQMGMDKATLGCEDDWNSLDHFDPTSPGRVQLRHFYQLRKQYPSLLDGFNLVQRGNWTYDITRLGSNGTVTEVGLWSIERSPIPGIQKLNSTTSITGTAETVWMLVTNENKTLDYSFACSDALWISSPYQANTVVRNLLPPFENYTLEASGESYNDDNKAPWRGCLPKVSMDLFGYKILVPASIWVAPNPVLTSFSPGHDYRITGGGSGQDDINIALEFNDVMTCAGVTAALSVNVSSGGSFSSPSIKQGTCGPVTNPDPSPLSGGLVSAWQWTGTISNCPDGIIELILNSPKSANGVATGSTDHLLLRKGTADNVMVFPTTADYDNSAFSYSDGTYTFKHKALGADALRYSWNYGMNWSDWTNYEATSTITKDVFVKLDIYDGEHIMVQYWSALANTAHHIVHADEGFSGGERRVPQYIARGVFNEWGFDKGVNALMTKNDRGYWELEIMSRWPASVQLNVFGYDDYFYGDTDGDGVLDRIPPNSAAPNYLNMSAPPHPHLAWALLVDDATGRWWLEPRGRSAIGATMYALLLTIPILTATLAVGIFRWSFYGIYHNQYGAKPEKSHGHYFPILGGGGNKDGSTPTTGFFGGHSEKKGGDIIGWPEDTNKRRKCLIATLEYEIIDWKLKVKIGGLGVMSSLMGKSMTDVDLIWVVPKVKDIEYPAGDPADPIEVIIFGQPYMIEVETHVLDNITYVILDSPVFRAQTKADPYPQRMDDLSSAIFYSTWNQAIAATIKRYPLIDIYHINDYHGALAPLYLLPKVLPVCLSLHNAEFQGLWPLRTKEEMKEVCSAFNLSKEVCTKYVQFGNTFNLLHAAAAFISDHQKSIGVAGVSDKYGKRSWARYPALWTLKHVDSLPNPDPSDIAALDENPMASKDVQIDTETEAARPEMKRQAQEWAGIAQDPNSNLFVFVGRWSKQKGVDLIADVLPSLLSKRNDIQVIAVGPVIDLYGRFAAEKLARLMEMYPDKVYSKPEFTALPPFLFSGADFALIPSRDEPFGLVAVEFGRKGALGVGSRLGGLGLMPGWWFPVESTSTAHMLSQFTKTMKIALKSTEEERALLRARSAVQRFPVVEWRQRTEDLHRRSINTSRHLAGANAFRESDCDGAIPRMAYGHDDEDWNPAVQPEPTQPNWDGQSNNGLLTPGSHIPRVGSSGSVSSIGTALDSPQANRASIASNADGDYFSQRTRVGSELGENTPGGEEDYGNFLSRANRRIAREQRHVPDPFLDEENVAPNRPFGAHNRVSSVESISSIMDEKGATSPLNKAIASFTDADGEVVQSFVSQLQMLTPENSKGDLSIEKFLTKSEEAFFDKVKKDKISSAVSLRSHRDSTWGAPSSYESRPGSPAFGSTFNLDDYSGALPNGPPEAVLSRLQIIMMLEIGGWPLYTIVMAIGQMFSATSFQITLLSGQNWQEAWQMYVLGGIFLVASAIWYALFRLKPSVWILTAPWFFFGIAFFLIGLPSISSVFEPSHKLLSAIATWSYAVGSAAAFTFFGLNFGEEAGAATEVWALRACIVQGLQQCWVAALWYWGNSLNAAPAGYRPPWWVVLILWPLAAMCILFAYCMAYGLPDYYRQVPPKIPHFLRTLFHRKLVLWFLASEILRDYWLSGPYGRNWAFLWSAPINKAVILALIVVFFVIVWGILLGILTYFAKSHTWLLAVFAVGLGAPRWCQMLWGTSSLALYIPWAGNAGPYLGTSLWLWLGVLDAIQGVGLGMILLQTLSRLHVCATLAFSQVIGSIAVMVARGTAPNRLGPASVFPDASTWDFQDGLKGSPIANAPFWIALICQIVIVVGYFWFYRKEQLARP